MAYSNMDTSFNPNVLDQQQVFQNLEPAFGAGESNFTDSATHSDMIEGLDNYMHMDPSSYTDMLGDEASIPGPEASTPSPVAATVESQPTPRKRGGRKRKDAEPDPELSDNSQQKRQELLERNRKAAEKCRRKKKERTALLEDECREKQRESIMLRAKVDKLQQDKHHLLNLLIAHAAAAHSSQEAMRLHAIITEYVRLSTDNYAITQLKRLRQQQQMQQSVSPPDTGIIPGTATPQMQGDSSMSAFPYANSNISSNMPFRPASAFGLFFDPTAPQHSQNRPPRPAEGESFGQSEAMLNAMNLQSAYDFNAYPS